VRVSFLTGALAELKRIESLNPSGYELAVKNFCGRFRDCWNRFIEEKLFGGVLTRFSQEIQTTRARYVEVSDPMYARIVLDVAGTIRQADTDNGLDAEDTTLDIHRAALVLRAEVDALVSSSALENGKPDLLVYEGWASYPTFTDGVSLPLQSVSTPNVILTV